MRGDGAYRAAPQRLVQTSSRAEEAGEGGRGDREARERPWQSGMAVRGTAGAVSSQHGRQQSRALRRVFQQLGRGEEGPSAYACIHCRHVLSDAQHLAQLDARRLGKVRRVRDAARAQLARSTAVAGLWVEDSPDDGGALVAGVVPSGPGALAGVRKDDVMVSLDGETFSRNGQALFEELIRTSRPGSYHEIGIYRKGSRQVSSCMLMLGCKGHVLAEVGEMVRMAAGVVLRGDMSASWLPPDVRAAVVEQLECPKCAGFRLRSEWLVAAVERYWENVAAQDRDRREAYVKTIYRIPGISDPRSVLAHAPVFSPANKARDEMTARANELEVSGADELVALDMMSSIRKHREEQRAVAHVQARPQSPADRRLSLEDYSSDSGDGSDGEDLGEMEKLMRRQKMRTTRAAMPPAFVRAELERKRKAEEDQRER